ncbi:MAG: response regulator, partial [Candidatus Obscuribacterales bacterium]|nr:response regulator [Candidatus Obscuribacterales bacterium]
TVEQLLASVPSPQSTTEHYQPNMRNTAELLIPPGALMKGIQEAGNAATSASGSFNSILNPPTSTAPPASSTQKNSGSFNANPSAGQDGTALNRNTGPLPVQSGAAGSPGGAETTKVLGGFAAPPLSAAPGNIEQTALVAPVISRPTAEIRRSTRLSHIPNNRKFAILVDNNVGNLAPIRQTLEERGLLVEPFATAAELKEAVSERLPDVLIVGTPLMDSNGYELVEYVRGLEAGNTPIILIIGQQAAFLDKVQAIRVGADAFFEYPSELIDLIDKLNNLLDRERNESYKILSVEDDPDQANFIKLTLESADYKVLHISDPKLFEEHFLSFEPDLVILDVVLGEVTGFELAKYIRQNDRFATLPIVFMTTQNKLHQHIRSAIAGGDEHLIKPVAPQLLIATVASRLERARSLKRLIDRDGLTRCLNYGSFMERAQKLATLDGYRSAPAMMMIDVDNMKMLNEKLGYAAGDRIISNIANMLLKGFRNTDLIARFGNDQFAIVLEHLNPQQLQSISSQVLAAISGTPQIVRGRPVTVTCSGGVSVLEQGMSVGEWLAAAQESLKIAKESGGNRAVVKPR